MQRLTLIKICSSSEVGHLYEHLYVSALVGLFSKHNLFQHVDYTYSAYTYAGGFIHIHILLISPGALTLAEAVKKVSPEFDDESVAGGLLELAAEEQGTPQCDFKLVQKNLKELHEEPWQMLDDFTYLNTPKTRRNKSVLSFSEKKPRYFKTIFTELSLDQNFSKVTPTAKPLFWVISDVLINNILHEIVAAHSYYPYYLATNTVGGLKTTRRYRGLKIAEPKSAEVLETCKQSLKTMFDKDIVDRVIRHAKEDFNRLPMGSPDELEIYNDTNVLVGKAGWERIATVENIRKALQHTTLRVKCGSDTCSCELSSLINSPDRR